MLVIWPILSGGSADSNAVPEHWAGMSTGNHERCSPFTVNLIFGGGEITGQATTPSRRGHAVEWEVIGRVGVDNPMRMTTRTMRETIDPARRSTAWVGRLSGNRRQTPFGLTASS